MRAVVLTEFGPAGQLEATGGGVGSLLVQRVRNAGAIVVAAAAGARKLELARELGPVVGQTYELEQAGAAHAAIEARATLGKTLLVV